MKFFLTSNLKCLMLPFIYSVPLITKKNSFIFSPLLGLINCPYNPNTFNLFSWIVFSNPLIIFIAVICGLYRFFHSKIVTQCLGWSCKELSYYTQQASRFYGEPFQSVSFGWSKKLCLLKYTHRQTQEARSDFPLSVLVGKRKEKEYYLTIRNCNYRKLKATGNTCNRKLHIKSTVDNYSDLSLSFLPLGNHPCLCASCAFSLTRLVKAISDLLLPIKCGELA